MYDVVKQAQLPCAGQTIAEGIAVKEPGALTRKIVGELVKDVLLVREEEIERAVATLLEIEKTVVEGAGAVWSLEGSTGRRMADSDDDD